MIWGRKHFVCASVSCVHPRTGAGGYYKVMGGGNGIVLLLDKLNQVYNEC